MDMQMRNIVPCTFMHITMCLLVCESPAMSCTAWLDLYMIHTSVSMSSGSVVEGLVGFILGMSLSKWSSSQQVILSLTIEMNA